MQTAYSVIPSPNINTMIVTGSPSQLTQVDNLITRVDVRCKQVLIDAVMMDREKGSINVGQNVPFLVSTETSNNGSLVQKIERQNVGLGLSVVPHIVNDSVRHVFPIAFSSNFNQCVSRNYSVWCQPPTAWRYQLPFSHTPLPPIIIN